LKQLLIKVDDTKAKKAESCGDGTN